MSNDVKKERLLLAALVRNEAFRNRTVAYLKPEYWSEQEESLLLSSIIKFINRYSVTPSKTDLITMVRNDDHITDVMADGMVEVIDDVYGLEVSDNTDYLVDTCEEFCKDKALFNAIQDAILVYNGESKKGRGTIPKVITDALAISFDTKLGQEYLADAQERWEYYNNPETKVAFDIEAFNTRTNGGLPRKTLNIWSAGSNVGKTASLVSLASMYMRRGCNVLYFSNEMSEQMILQRIDANLMDIPINEVASLDKDTFNSRIMSIKKRQYGKCVVKDYPTGTANALIYGNFIAELKLKRGFVPDVILVDYLQITNSNSGSRGENSFTKYKAVAEELRALFIEHNVIGWTAVQLNRNGAKSDNPEMTDVGESFAIAQTADTMWGLSRTEELDEMGQLLVTEMKTRFGDKSKPRFTVGMDISRQKMYEIKTPEYKPKEIKRVEVKAPAKVKQHFETSRRSKFQSFKYEDDTE